MMTDNRCRMLYVNADCVGKIAAGKFEAVERRNGQAYLVKCDDRCEVPVDANVIGVHYDPHRRIFLVCIEHESFEPVLLGAKVPVLSGVSYRETPVTITEGHVPQESEEQR